jgi:hypothetical protein
VSHCCGALNLRCHRFYLIDRACQHVGQLICRRMRAVDWAKALYPVPWRLIGQRMHTRTAQRCGADLRRVTMWWPPMCAGSRLSRAAGIAMRWLADRAADVVVLQFNGLNPTSSLAASNQSGHLLVEPLVARTELPCNEVRHCTPPACRGTDGTRAVYRDRRVVGPVTCRRRRLRSAVGDA